MSATYRAVPALLCSCPAKTFRDAVSARLYAEKAAAEFRVGYTVYRVLAGRIRIVARFPAPVART